MNVIYICKSNYKYNNMEQPKEFVEHPNSAFIRLRKRTIHNSDVTTEEPNSDSVSKTLSARQIAFREIKKLFGVDTNTNTKSIYPSKKY